MASWPDAGAPRILHLARSDQMGGASRAAYRLHRALCDAGACSLFVTADRSRDDPTVIPTAHGPVSKFFVQAVDYANSRIPRLYRRDVAQNFSTVRLSYGRLDRRLVEASDIVCLHWVAGAFLRPAQIARIARPMIWMLHDFWPFTGGCHHPGTCSKFETVCGRCPALGSRLAHDLARIDFNARDRAYPRMALTAISPTRWLADQARRSALLGGRRIEHVASGVELDVFRPHDRAAARELLGLPPDRKIIVFGAFQATGEHRKGYHLLPQIMRSLAVPETARDVTLVIFGGPVRPPDQGEEFGVPAIHLGRLADKISLALLFSAADVMIAPYLEDNLAQVILESLACGTPAVAFDVGGISEAIEHRRNGYLAPVGATDELARGLDWVLAEPARQAQLRLAARATAEAKFDLRHSARRYLDLFRELAATPRSRARR